MDVFRAKIKDFQNHHMDSTMWDGFSYRADDIIIGSHIKSGTTWTQQIVSQLLFEGEDKNVATISPWVDLRLQDKQEVHTYLENQKHRRFMKTHLPATCLDLYKDVQYVYIARDMPDVVMSVYNHHKNHTDEFYEVINAWPDRIGSEFPKHSGSEREYFLHWLEHNADPYWPYFENIKSWWDVKDNDNVKLLHYNDLLEDLDGSVEDLAEFLKIPLDPFMKTTIVSHCSFDYMKTNAKEIVPLGGSVWKGGAKTFINKGTNKRWLDHLIYSDFYSYRDLAREELGDACAYWLENGRF